MLLQVYKVISICPFGWLERLEHRKLGQQNYKLYTEHTYKLFTSCYNVLLYNHSQTAAGPDLPYVYITHSLHFFLSLSQLKWKG